VIAQLDRSALLQARGACGQRALSADTALRLGKYFGVSPEIWLDLQSDYELRLARRTTWRRVEPRVRVRVA